MTTKVVEARLKAAAGYVAAHAGGAPVDELAHEVAVLEAFAPALHISPAPLVELTQVTRPDVSAFRSDGLTVPPPEYRRIVIQCRPARGPWGDVRMAGVLGAGPRETRVYVLREDAELGAQARALGVASILAGRTLPTLVGQETMVPRAEYNRLRGTILTMKHNAEQSATARDVVAAAEICMLDLTLRIRWTVAVRGTSWVLFGRRGRKSAPFVWADGLRLRWDVPRFCRACKVEQVHAEGICGRLKDVAVALQYVRSAGGADRVLGRGYRDACRLEQARGQFVKWAIGQGLSLHAIPGRDRLLRFARRNKEG